MRSPITNLRRAAALGAVLAAIACRGRPATPDALPALRLAGDTVRADTVADGVVHWFVYRREGPWAIHLLDVDRARCWTPVAAKARGGGAVGRETTTGIVGRLADSLERAAGGARAGPPLVVGGVNADFFSFNPPGVPLGAHVEDGRMVAGPGVRPVFAVDSAGRPWIGVLRARGVVRLGAESLVVRRWNRPPAPTAGSGGLAVFDPRWGAVADSTHAKVELAAERVGRGAEVALDSATRVAIPPRGLAVLADSTVDAGTASLLRALAGRRDVRARVELEPVHPRDAVGGFPLLLSGGVQNAELDRANNAGFRGRNPRTAVAVGVGGRRVVLVVVDGRQPGYSMGMSLREMLALVRELGAEDALNLDGGGSSAMALRARGDSLFRPANVPSDSARERAVANALVVVRDCRRAGVARR